MAGSRVRVGGAGGISAHWTMSVRGERGDVVVGSCSFISGRPAAGLSGPPCVLLVIKGTGDGTPPQPRPAPV